MVGIEYEPLGSHLTANKLHVTYLKLPFIATIALHDIYQAANKSRAQKRYIKLYLKLFKFLALP